MLKTWKNPKIIMLSKRQTKKKKRFYLGKILENAN